MDGGIILPSQPFLSSALTLRINRRRRRITSQRLLGTTGSLGGGVQTHHYCTTGGHQVLFPWKHMMARRVLQTKAKAQLFIAVGNHLRWSEKWVKSHDPQTM
jgi:hypothetical protein